ncbi:hypothetical protein GCM10023063_11750 [Arthrobacter methylotrophus]
MVWGVRAPRNAPGFPCGYLTALEEARVPLEPKTRKYTNPAAKRISTVRSWTTNGLPVAASTATLTTLTGSAGVLELGEWDGAAGALDDFESKGDGVGVVPTGPTG